MANTKRESTIVREPTPFLMTRRSTSFSLARILQPGHTPADNLFVDEIYCLPHATYHPTNRRISFPAGHPGPHGIIFFTPKPQISTGWSKTSGESRLLPFAIVLGQKREPEYAFVLLLGSESPDEDFHRIFRKDKRLVGQCMTKEQLKKRLRETSGRGFQWHPSTSVHSHQLDSGLIHAGMTDISKWESWDLRLFVAVQIGPLNLMENTSWVFLQSKKTVCETSQGMKTRSERNNLQEFDDEVKYRLRNWWKMKELG